MSLCVSEEGDKDEIDFRLDFLSEEQCKALVFSVFTVRSLHE